MKEKETVNSGTKGRMSIRQSANGNNAYYTSSNLLYSTRFFSSVHVDVMIDLFASSDRSDSGRFDAFEFRTD